MTPPKPLATVPPNADKKAREKAIAEAAANKKKSTPPPATPPTKKSSPKIEKKEDDDMVSVSEIARGLGIDPKRARAKLRAGGASATDGRWPKVKRGSKRYQELVDLLTPADSDEAEDDEDEE